MTELEIIKKEEELAALERDLKEYAKEIQLREQRVKEREMMLDQGGEVDSIFDLVNAHRCREPEKKSPKGLSLRLIW